MKGVNSMRIRRLVVLVSVVIGIVALNSVPASAAPTLPFRATSTRVTTLNTDTLTGTVTGGGTATFLGKYTYSGVFTSFVLTGSNTFTETISATWVAANGDKLFDNSTGTGSYTTDASGAVTSVAVTTVLTIDGGTGRFADATGTLTTVAGGTSTVVSDTNGILVVAATGTQLAIQGTISF
jgi:hypothetical protein